MSDDVRLALLVEALIDGFPAANGAEPPGDDLLRHRRLAILLQAEARCGQSERTVQTVAGLIAGRSSSRRAATVSRLRSRLRPLRQPRRHPLRARSWRWLAAATLAVAALAAGTAMVRSALRPPVDPARITVLACNGGAELRPGVVFARGEVVRLPADASASLVLGDGSRIEAAGPLELVAGPTAPGVDLRLQAGDLRVAAAPQRPEAPLRIRSPHAEISVVGTVFRFSTAPTGTRLVVDEGSVRFAPNDEGMRLIGPGGAASAWPAPQLSADFEDGRMPPSPPAWHGRIVKGPARSGNRFCFEGVLFSQRYNCFGVLIDDLDPTRPGLFPYRPGTRLRCRLWITGDSDWALVVGSEGRSGDVERILSDLQREMWTTLEVDLGTLPPWHPDTPPHLRLQEGDWIRELRFYADARPGLGIYLDDLVIVPRGAP